MYSPHSLPRNSRVRAEAKLKAAHGVTSTIGESSWQAPPRPNKVREQSFVVVGADGEKSVVLMRVATASALGILAASLPSSMFGSIVSSLIELLSSTLGIQRQVQLTPYMTPSHILLTMSCFKHVASMGRETAATINLNCNQCWDLCYFTSILSLFS